LVTAPRVPVVRSPSDFLRLVVAVAVLVVVVLVEVLFGGAVVGFVHDLLRGLDAVRGSVATAVAVGVRVIALVLLAAGLVAAAAPATSVRSLVAIVCGWVGGAAAVVALGAPAARPGRDAVLGALRSVGVDAATLEGSSVDARGSTPYFADTGDGHHLFVK